MKASWSLNGPLILRTIDFESLQNPKIGFSALLTEELKKVPKIIKIHTKNCYKDLHEYVYSQLPVVSWKARINEIKLFDQQHEEICGSIRPKT